METPLLATCPGIDLYVDALAVAGGRFLPTSPELFMKRLLSAGSGPIYQITRSFRAGERGNLHNPEFTILEWYTPGADHRALMNHTELLVREAAAALEQWGGAAAAARWPVPFRRVTVDAAFREHAGWVPSRRFDPERFFLDLVDKVEPALAQLGAFFLHDFPAPLGSLARLRDDDSLVAERFELYLEGVEICNGFSELTDRREQESRFTKANEARAAAGKEVYPVDSRFLDALEAGLPACAGNALGVDRLLMVLTGAGTVDEVIPFTHEQA